MERATIEGAHLAVSGFALDNPAISSIDLTSFAPFFGRAPQGVLGYELFRSRVVQIDYEQRTLTLFDPKTFQPPAGASTIAIETSQRQPYATASVVLPGGKSGSGRFEIDTGSMDALNLNTPFAASHGVDASARGAVAVRGRSMGGETNAVLLRAETLRLGDVTLTAPVASVVEDQVDRAGQISAESLRRFTVTFDYSRERLYLNRNAAFDDPFEMDMAGWFIVASGPALDGRGVYLVLDHSPAALAGVKTGDALLRVDGRPVEAISLDALRRLFKVPGRTFRIDLKRDGSNFTIRLTTRRLL